MSICLDELNESQRAAVLYMDGPSLVIAGAGSGKTRVLTSKIAYLLDNGYDPWSILALTFTNKAAREMKERIARQVGIDKARSLWMGTFHSIFLRILRIESALLGFSSNFTIYDAADSKSLIKGIIKDMKLDDKIYRPELVQNRISQAKNKLIFADAYAVDAGCYQADCETNVPEIREIYRQYCARCRQSDAMDFDDLLLYTYLLFEQHPEICKKYAERFRYVLVDEYQDTNYAQHAIVYQLTKENRQICVVGDDAQSIYSFRGANIDNILNFTGQYKEARLFKLEQNYRSTQTIVNAANSLIAKNRKQIHKKVFSEKDKGDLIKVYKAYSDVEEGEIVMNTIVRLHKNVDYSYSDFAILYRTNAQSRVFEEALRKRGMPYRVYGGLSFYQRKEIKDVIAYFRLAINPNDEEAFKRVINYPARGIGDTTLTKIVEAAVQSGTSLWRVLNEPMAFGLKISKNTVIKLQGFRDLIVGFIEDATQRNAYEVGRDIVRRSGIMQDVQKDRSPENLSKQENIEELVNGMHDFCVSRQEEGNEYISLSDYLSEVALLTDQDDDTDDDAKISLMTIHSAKGLEFKNVFVVGLEENLFPSPRASESYRQLEEERRLFYVAITRAEEHCFLSFAKSRFKYGRTELSSPSRFLKDIDACYLDLPGDFIVSQQVDSGVSRFREDFRKTIVSQTVHTMKPEPIRRLRSLSVEAVPSDSKLTSNVGLSVGQHIEHERFGMGEILKIEGTGSNCKATVQFQNVGIKQLLLKFARFKIVD